jgi:hypothetical protein
VSPSARVFYIQLLKTNFYEQFLDGGREIAAAHPVLNTTGLFDLKPNCLPAIDCGT